MEDVGLLQRGNTHLAKQRLHMVLDERAITFDAARYLNFLSTHLRIEPGAVGLKGFRLAVDV
jgi:hypothetical protein